MGRSILTADRVYCGRPSASEPRGWWASCPPLSIYLGRTLRDALSRIRAEAAKESAEGANQ